MAKVSVIIPTYNYGEFICDAIDSVLNQTFKDFEIIVVDDGSTDNTKDIIKKYRDKISYYYKTNDGPASARNLGIKKSNGKYICFLDADDIFLPNKLELQVNLLKNNSNKNISLVYSDFLIVNKNLNKVLKYYKCKKFLSHNQAFNYLMLDNYINTSTVMTLKDCLFEVNLFNEKYKYLEDYDLWIKLGINYEYIYINKPLVKTRAHYKNYSKKVNNSIKTTCFNEIKKNMKKPLF
ncbi:glycosyltransferase [Tepidibacter thalassicus]|uniref:Glycosyl transferase family 2 n=1 Tax=Tepidibacter thalassicus DSM 15285 TaxID=1123350 RepID=A0A1M5PF00_9FIRM|nr:glycosyltransferase [Tepidibacter thalassicus]SHH00330.1 Glycosyl transferase family 2 [Tepidibacter thalassicus DSM 15285]